MGRKKLKIKRIEDIKNRQATYSKRRNGLIKKAYELSVLCDIDIALLSFSPADRLSIFSGANTSFEDVFTRYINLPHQQRANALVYPDQRRPDFTNGDFLLGILQQIKSENEIAEQSTKFNHPAINSEFEELQQHLCQGAHQSCVDDALNKLQQELHMAEEQLRKFEPDPSRFTTMEEYETCEKQLNENLTRLTQIKEQLFSSEASRPIQQQNISGPYVNDVGGVWLGENGPSEPQLFDPSVSRTLLQRSISNSNQNSYIGGPFVNDVGGVWLGENGPNEAQLFDPSVSQTLVQGRRSSSNQNNTYMGGSNVNDVVGEWLRENAPNQTNFFGTSAYQTLLQRSSSNSNQNNNYMGGCHVSVPIDDILQELGLSNIPYTAQNLSTIFPTVQQHGEVGPIVGEHLSSYDASMAIQQQNMGGSNVNEVGGGFLDEIGPNQAHLFDTLLQGNSSSSNQNNNYYMGECNVPDPIAEILKELDLSDIPSTAENLSTMFPTIQQNQHGTLDPIMKESEIPVTTTETQADDDVFDSDIADYIASPPK